MAEGTSSLGEGAEQLVSKKGGTSFVWTYFGFEKNDVNQMSPKCKLCLRAVATTGNTTNLHQHLRNHHRLQHSGCTGAVHGAEAATKSSQGKRPRRASPVREKKMSKGQTLRDLVKKRLAAAAEDIFVLFESMIAEYEEELCRSKEENQRKQQLLDNDPSPRIELVRGNFQISSTSPGAGLNQEITESPQIKEEPEEQSVKQEEEQLPVSVPESSGVCVKTGESSLLQPRQTERREETQEEEISSEPLFHSETEGQTEHSSYTDNDDDWEPPVSCSPAQMETEADGDHYNQYQIRNRNNKLFPQNKTAPETTVHNEDISGADRKKHQCLFCEKRFTTKQMLKRHIRIHTRESSIYKESCVYRGHRDKLVRKQKEEKYLECRVCKKKFTQMGDLNKHVRIHAGEKPYSSPLCKKTFSQQGSLDKHLKSHREEKPYSCAVCSKAFSTRSGLKSHLIIHTGESSVSEECCNDF